MDQLLRAQVVVNNFKQLFTGVPIGRAVRTSRDDYCLGFYKSLHKAFGEIFWAAGNSLGYGTILAHSVDKNCTFALMVNSSRHHVGLYSEGLVSDILQKIFNR